MGTKSIDWRPGPTVCRCCLAEGCYKDISTEYFWMGKREVYSEMLSETFDISIAYSTSGPNSNSRLICEPCISRLRDAAEFKRQVHECEKTFTQYLDPGASSTMLDTQVSVEALDGEVKLEQVKQEKAHSDDDDDFAGPNFPDDDDDDLDDQPLTKFATRVPKKESVDLLDLLDNAKAAEKRKSTTRAKAPPPKKIKVNLKDIQMKPTASKTKSSQGKVLKITPTKPIQVKAVTKVVKKKKELDDYVVAKRNAELIVEYATAYPFRLPEESLVCVYCGESYDEPSQYRQHMDADHKKFKVRLAFLHLSEGYIKADCTDLRCRICWVSLENLEDTAKHLVNVHNRKIDLKVDLGLQPFMLDNDKTTCYICGARSPCLRQLSRHTQTHFLKYTCESCGKSYATISTLRHHIRFSHINQERICRKCRRTFPNLEERRRHLMESEKCWSHLCSVCPERFISWTAKQAHLTEAHNAPKKTYVCPECREVFFDRKKYRVHFKLQHTNEVYTCSCCSLKFETKRNLEEHRVVHTKEKLFECTVCFKSFPRKKNLTQHMWIHSEVKRFECTLCNKQFNQRVSWKTHMKSYHPELVDFEEWGVKKK